VTRVSSIFSQILRLIPRLDFESAVRQHNAERRARGFTRWGHVLHVRRGVWRTCEQAPKPANAIRLVGIPEASAQFLIDGRTEWLPLQDESRTAS
jgi:hypothetical protein